MTRFTPHVKEWQKSAISSDLIRENLRSVEGDDALDQLFTSEDLPRINSGRVARWLLTRYDHCRNGGWYCRSYDPVHDCEMLWNQFKPDTPRKTKQYQDYKGFSTEVENQIKEKIIKYESTPKMKARIILPYVPLERWIEISNKYDCPVNFNKYSNFWQWVIDNHQLPINIVEGGKKALSLLSQNIIAIALPGVTMGIRKVDENLKQLHPDLKLFASEDREIYILFDADIKLNTVKAVSKAIFSLGSQLQKAKCKVQICSWSHQLGKGIDDVLFGSENKQEVLKNIYESSLGFNFWCCQWLFKLRTPDMRFNQRWFSDGLTNIPYNRLIALKSAQNTGKTEVIVKKVLELVRQGEAVFVFTHRESLARALAQRFGISYRTEEDPLKGYIGYSLCIDSLMPKDNGFNVDDWEEVTVILDECEQVISHLLNGCTAVKEFRPTIIKTLIQLAPKIRQMIIADANLSNIALNFCEELLQTNAYLIVNDYQFEGMKFNRFSNPKALLGLVKHKLTERENLFILSTGQKTTSKFGTIGLENFIRKLNPELKILRVDAETTGYPDSDSQGCLDQMSDIVLNYDVVICSPSIETGISIDVYNYFNSVIAFNTGNLTPHSFLQFMWRLRDTKAERYFYSAKCGNSYIGNGSQSPHKLLESNNKLAKNILSNLGLLDTKYDVQGVSKLFLDTWSKIGARINASSRCHHELLEHLITSQGHTIVDCLAKEIQTSEIEDNTKECRDNRDEKTLNSKDLFEHEAEELDKKKSKTLDEICQLRKYKVKEKYGDIDKEILEADDEGIYPTLKLLYYSTIGYEFIEDRDKQVINKLLKDNNNQLFAPDVVNSTIKHKVEMLRGINLLGLIKDIRKKGYILNNDSRIIELWTHAQQRQGLIKNVLGINVGKYPMAFFKSLVKTIGYDLDNRVQVRNGEDVNYRYELVELPSFTEQVLLYWHKNDTKVKERKQYEETMLNVDNEDPVTNTENKNICSVTNFPYSNNKEVDDPKLVKTEEEQNSGIVANNSNPVTNTENKNICSVTNFPYSNNGEVDDPKLMTTEKAQNSGIVANNLNPVTNLSESESVTNFPYSNNRKIDDPKIGEDNQSESSPINSKFKINDKVRWGKFVYIVKDFLEGAIGVISVNHKSAQIKFKDLVWLDINQVELVT